MSTNESTAVAITPEPEKLTKKALTADHPTWCPGCGDFAVLAAFYKVLERRQLPHESIVTLAGIGCQKRVRVSRRSLPKGGACPCNYCVIWN